MNFISLTRAGDGSSVLINLDQVCKIYHHNNLDETVVQFSDNNNSEHVLESVAVITHMIARSYEQERQKDETKVSSLLRW